MNPFMKIAKISCRQAALLGSKASFGKLNLLERMRLKMHLSMCICENCQNYADGNQVIDTAIQKILDERKNKKVALSEEQKKKILEALN